jgi:hypothetical protein
MKSKVRVLLSALTTAVLLVGLLPGCSGPDNPKIPEVPNLKEIESKVEKTTGPQKGRPPGYGKSDDYQRAYENKLERRGQ